jgi:hypothetical protein
MTGWYATTIIGISLVLVIWSAALLVTRRAPDLVLALGGVVLELLLIGFLIGGIAQMAGSEQDFARAEFIGYLLTGTVILPAAFIWARGDKSRAGLGVIAVAFLVLPVIVLRVQQVWAGSGV